MATDTSAQQKVMIKEMSWDPITRIVGQPGHPHRDRLHQPPGAQGLQHLDGVPRLRHLHEGDRSARRALHHEPHLRDLRRQPRDVLVPEPEHGLRRQAAAARRPRVQPRRVGRLHVRPRDLQRLHGERRLLRADGQGDQPDAARQGRDHAVARTRHPRLQDDRRHHAGAQPVHRRVLSRDAARRPLHARDVLPVRRPAHPPVDDHAGRLQRRHHPPDVHRLLRAADALFRLRQAQRADARRPLRLLPPGAAGVRHGRLPRDEPRQLGQLRRSRLRRLRLPHDDRLGSQALHHARAWRSAAS